MIPLRELPTAFVILRRVVVSRLGGPRTGGAQCLLVRDDGAVLFVKASYRRHWSLPGGFMEPGEDPVLAACRELTEETGLHGRDAHLVGTDARRFHDDHLVAAALLTRRPRRRGIDGVGDRHAARWVARDEIAAVIEGLHVNSKRLLHLAPGSVPAYIDALLASR